MSVVSQHNVEHDDGGATAGLAAVCYPSVAIW
jgi:hypothetical protein